MINHHASNSFHKHKYISIGQNLSFFFTKMDMINDFRLFTKVTFNSSPSYQTQCNERENLQKRKKKQSEIFL